MDYRDFLEGKRTLVRGSGIDIDRDAISPVLFEFQKDYCCVGRA